MRTSAPTSRVTPLLCVFLLAFFTNAVHAAAEQPAVCGTVHALSVRKQSLQVRRPANQHAYRSPSGRFLIHYDTLGGDAVRSDDADIDGVPDYVERTADAFDDAWDLQINTLGYDVPPLDGDGIYDVYLSDLGARGLYGLAWTEDIRDFRSASYIELDNDYLQSIYNTRGIDGMRVSAAHEFFHAVQFGYSTDVGVSWWQELTAVWMEDVAYDHVDDYLQYLPYYFNAPERSLDARTFGSDFHGLGGAVFAHYLEKLHGRDAVRGTWERIRAERRDDAGTHTLDRGLPAGGFADAFPRFAVWNLLTNDRSTPRHYPESARYPTPRATTVDLNWGSRRITGSVGHLAAAYVVMPRVPGVGEVSIDLSLPERDAWSVAVVSRTGPYVEVTYPPDDAFAIRDLDAFEETAIVLAVHAVDGASFPYGLTIDTTPSARPVLLPGDFDRNAVVGFSDFVLFAGAYDKKPTVDTVAAAMDLDADGIVDFADFIIFTARFGDER